MVRADTWSYDAEVMSVPAGFTARTLFRWCVSSGNHRPAARSIYPTPRTVLSPERRLVLSGIHASELSDSA
jgi:hypothetical protein